MGFFDGFKTNILDSSVTDIMKVGQRREFLRTYAISFLVALVMWALVNLGRNYPLRVEIPIMWGEFGENVAPVEPLPQKVIVDFYGEGWQLLNIYGDPPVFRVDATEEAINLQEVMRARLAVFGNLSITNVVPSSLRIRLDEKVEKRIPLRAILDVQFASLHDYIGQPRLEPDSVSISGAKSLLDTLSYWVTEPVQIKDVNTDLNLQLEINPGNSLINVRPKKASFTARVSEYTEGEIRLLVRTENAPSNTAITFSPSVITVRYDVPLIEYARSQEQIPYKAVVPFDELSSDSSGFVSPVITDVSDSLHIKLRSYRPRRVAYYFNISD